MVTRLLGDADIAMVRGVRNCGKHHPENATAPAVQFAQECSECAGDIFIVIWNARRENSINNLKQAGFE